MSQDIKRRISDAAGRLELNYKTQLIFKDIEAELQGDPATGNKEEIIFSYPGIYAISVYRIAHVLYELNVPFIPRIMTEHMGKQGLTSIRGQRLANIFLLTMAPVL